MPPHNPNLVALLEPAPCDTCRWKEVCSASGAACRSFAAFVDGKPEYKWRIEPNEPRLDIGKRLKLSGKI